MHVCVHCVILLTLRSVSHQSPPIPPRSAATTDQSLSSLSSSAVTLDAPYFTSLPLNYSAVEMSTLKLDALLVYGSGRHASKALCLERGIKPLRFF